MHFINKLIFFATKKNIPVKYTKIRQFNFQNFKYIENVITDEKYQPTILAEFKSNPALARGKLYLNPIWVFITASQTSNVQTSLDPSFTKLNLKRFFFVLLLNRN